MVQSTKDTISNDAYLGTLKSMGRDENGQKLAQMVMAMVMVVMMVLMMMTMTMTGKTV
jgi:hypothetical protein